LKTSPQPLQVTYPAQNRIIIIIKKTLSYIERKLTLSRSGFLWQVHIVSRVVISNEPVHE
jgi:hypothetical protein